MNRRKTITFFACLGATIGFLTIPWVGIPVFLLSPVFWFLASLIVGTPINIILFMVLYAVSVVVFTMAIVYIVFKIQVKKGRIFRS